MVQPMGGVDARVLIPDRQCVGWKLGSWYSIANGRCGRYIVVRRIVQPMATVEAKVLT